MRVLGFWLHEVCVLRAKAGDKCVELYQMRRRHTPREPVLIFMFSLWSISSSDLIGVLAVFPSV